MARRKRKGGRRGMLSNLAKKAGSIGGSIVQAVGVGHGLIYGISKLLQGEDPAKVPREIVWAYSGVNIDDGSFNQGQALKSVTIIGVTYLIGRGLKYVARRS